MKIEKNKDEFGNYEYTLTQDNLKFKMYYGGNLDLYWEIENMDVDMDNYETYEEYPLEFVISADNTELYSIFSELFESVRSSAKKIEEEEKRKEKAKMEALDQLVYVDEEQEPKAHEMVVRNNVVVWHSDDEVINHANYVTVTRIDGDIIVTFRKLITENGIPGIIPIRFSNSGSKYAPFNVYFMKLYCSMERLTINGYQEDQHKRKLTNN